MPGPSADGPGWARNICRFFGLSTSLNRPATTSFGLGTAESGTFRPHRLWSHAHRGLTHAETPTNRVLAPPQTQNPLLPCDHHLRYRDLAGLSFGASRGHPFIAALE